MARGAEAKLRRRNRKKATDDAVIDMFGTEGGDENNTDDNEDDTFQFPTSGVSKSVAGKSNIDDTDDDDDEDANLPKKNKKPSKTRPDGSTTLKRDGASSSGLGSIKTTPLILLIMMVGTTLLPALIYAGDYASSLMARNNILGGIGFRLGIGAVPKQRVRSFYEKHAPEKLDDVPSILAKHYGKYPQLIKKLERKYQDYCYFMGWEQDEAPLRIVQEQVQALYDTWIQQYWNRYSPQFLKTAFRNIRYNLTFLVKKGRKLWKRRLWPLLEPIFGVPDGAEAQKRQDAARARQRKQKASSSSSRRRNTDFRDDEE
jgi:hypothetical protein